MILQSSGWSFAGVLLRIWVAGPTGEYSASPIATAKTRKGSWNRTGCGPDVPRGAWEALGWMYTGGPKERPTRHNHLSTQEWNAEIIRRRKNGENLPSLARAFGLTVQRVWYIVARGGCGTSQNC